MSTTISIHIYPDMNYTKEDKSIPVSFFFVVLLLLLSDCAALDTISANQEIKDGETLVSRGQMYELGFFSPGNSKNRYLGIWYKKISTGTVVWVANRETPITDNSGIFRVSREGNLLILSGGNSVIWSSTSTLNVRSNNPVVQLLGTGNLVVWDKNSTKQKLIWQSFDYPSDTWLPGMKFGKDFLTGRETCMTSWKSPDDPSTGVYKVWVETKGYPQIFERHGPVIHARIGPWNGLGYSGFPKDIPNPIYSVEFVVNHKEIYHKYELTSSVVQRIVLTWDGKTQMLHWIERIQDWVVYTETAVDSCSRFGVCGPYASCSMTKHPPCVCMVGFKPQLPKEWEASDWSSGCQRKKPLDCGSGDGFRKITGVKLPDTRFSWYNQSMGLGECEMACRRNCSCTAYANLDIRNGGSGCLLWFDELMDMREYDEDHNIYIRMAASELEDETRGSILDWPRRFEIIQGIARGLLYLHQDSRIQIIHRDLKAANILLDSDMNAKISDFGLAREFVGHDITAETKKVVGTHGYISPEYALYGRFSTKSDVFSFGVMVLEIISGVKNREFFHEDHRDNLLGHAWRLYKEDKSNDLLSASLRTSCVVSEVLRSIHVGLLCVQHHPEDRPIMLSVVLMLIGNSALPAPKQPAFFTGERYREPDCVSSVDEDMITLLYAR